MESFLIMAMQASHHENTFWPFWMMGLGIGLVSFFVGYWLGKKKGEKEG